MPLENPHEHHWVRRNRGGAVALANAKGTAPGLWIERSGVACVALPGPPRELRAMFDAVARDRVAPRSCGHGIFRRVIRVTGRTKSHVV